MEDVLFNLVVTVGPDKSKIKLVSKWGSIDFSGDTDTVTNMLSQIVASVVEQHQKGKG